jgi:polyisoprenoid-binding protein YceI
MSTHRYLFVSLLLLLATSAHGESRTYTIQPAPGTRVELRVTKTGFLRGKQHLFVFERYKGAVTYDPGKPEASEVSMMIESASAVCKDTWVSAKDLRKIQEFALKDMLDAGNHPNITFSSTSIRPARDGKYEVEGTLTIRNVAKPAIVLVALSSHKETSLTATGTAEIRMTDYGLKPPTAALGTIGTKNEMSFSFEIVGSTDKRSLHGRFLNGE